MKLSFDFSIQEVADKFIAVAKNRETGNVEQVFTLNETGALILNGLQKGKDIPAITEQLLTHYDVQPKEAEAEVKAFIDMLVNNGLVSL